jgi:aspartate/tyrosine/aromatic aminotransferase
MKSFHLKSPTFHSLDEFEERSWGVIGEREKWMTALETSAVQGCQIFLGTWCQNRIKCTKWIQNVPNSHKISQISIKFSKWSWNTYINIFQSKALQNPNWDFWFKNKPSGNPGAVNVLIYVQGCQIYLRTIYQNGANLPSTITLRI